MVRKALLLLLLVLILGCSGTDEESTIGEVTEKNDQLFYNGIPIAGEKLLEIMMNENSAVEVVPYTEDDRAYIPGTGQTIKWGDDFKFVVGYPEVHPLRPCVNEKVLHSHVKLKYKGKWIFHIHAGAYISKGSKTPCVVLYNDRGKWQFCKYKCAPTYKQTKKWVKDTLKDLFRKNNINVNKTVVIALINTAATVIALMLMAMMYSPLLAV